MIGYIAPSYSAKVQKISELCKYFRQNFQAKFADFYISFLMLRGSDEHLFIAPFFVFTRYGQPCPTGSF